MTSPKGIEIIRSRDRVPEDDLWFTDWGEADDVLRKAGMEISDISGYFTRDQIPQVCAILRLNGYSVEVEE